jgi:hypothetical protein
MMTAKKTSMYRIRNKHGLPQGDFEAENEQNAINAMLSSRLAEGHPFDHFFTTEALACFDKAESSAIYTAEKICPTNEYQAYLTSLPE